MMTRISSTRYRGADWLLRIARRLPGDARASLCAEIGAVDESLATTLRALLDAYESDRPELDQPAWNSLPHDDQPSASDATVLPQIPGHEVQAIIGAGAMGTVYRARQLSPPRSVALKILRPSVSTNEARRRFRLESEILASISHPGLAQVFNAGEYGEAPRSLWYTMELVEGMRLDEFASQTQPSITERVRLMVQICEAMTAAHTAGVVHRDLKPSNILVDAKRDIKVIDFGVARLVGPEQGGALTLTGGVIGTIDYMSPEQLEADAGVIGPPSDVYSLGVILYEMLTGKRPLALADVPLASALDRLRTSDPTRLRLIDATIPRDLETIVETAMAYEPTRRYASAAALGAELRRFLDGRPIEARPATILYRANRFVRRYRSLVVWTSAFAAMLVFATIVSLSLFVEASVARRNTRWELYVANTAAAEVGLRDGRFQEARARLLSAPPEHRGWEWRHLWTRTNPAERTLHHGSVWQGRCAFDPTGTRVATGDFDGILRVFDAESGAILHEIEAHEFEITALAYSPSGAHLVTAGWDDRLVIWDAATGALLRERPVPMRVVRAVWIDDAEESIWAGSESSVVRLSFEDLDHETLPDEGVIPRTLGFVAAPGDSTLIMVEEDGSLHRAQLRSIVVEQDDIQLPGDAVIDAFTLSHDGRRLALSLRFSTFPDAYLAVVRVDDLKSVARWPAHDLRIDHLAFLSDGRLLSASQDRRVRLWDWEGPAPRLEREWVGHDGGIDGLALSPDGVRFVTTSNDGSTKSWKLDGWSGERVLTFEGRCTLVDWRHDGQAITVGLPRAVIEAELSGGGRTLNELTSFHLQFARNDRPVAVNQSGAWFADTGESIVIASDDHLRCAHIADGSDELMVAGLDGRLDVIDVKTGEVLRQARIGVDPVHVVTAPPDGARIWIGTSTTIYALDGATLDILASRPIEEAPLAITVAPGADVFAVSFIAKPAVRIFDSMTLEPVARCTGHSAPVGALAFSPDGTRLASGSNDFSIKLWETKRWRETVTLRGHTGDVTDLAFSPDGLTLASAGHLDQTVRLWSIDPAVKSNHAITTMTTDRR